LQACISACHRSNVKVPGEPIDYGDITGYSVRVLEGRSPQQYMKNTYRRDSACFSAAADGSASVKWINGAG